MKKSFFLPLWRSLPQSSRCSPMRVWWKEIFLSVSIPYQLHLAAAAEDTCNKVLHVFPTGWFRSRPSPAEFHSLPHRQSWSGTYRFSVEELSREHFQVYKIFKIFFNISQFAHDISFIDKKNLCIVVLYGPEVSRDKFLCMKSSHKW